jgi:hypothetical protein
MVNYMQELEFDTLSHFVVQGNIRTFLGDNVVDQGPVSSGQLHSQP